MYRNIAIEKSSALRKKKRKITASRVRELGEIYLMTGIPYLFFAVFVIYPISWILKYSFYDYDGLRATFTGMENFVRLFNDAIWWKAVGNTFILTAVGLVIGTSFPLLLAVLLNMKLVGRGIMRSVFYLPCLISTAIVGVIFKIMLSPGDGIINAMLLALNPAGKPLYILGNSAIALTAIVLIGLWQGSGYTMTLFLAALQKIPPELYEAAKIDGAGEMKKFFYITIPQLSSMIKMMIMLGIIGNLKTFDLVSVLTNGHPNHGTETIATYTFNYFFERDGYSAQQGYASAVGVAASVIILIFTLIYLYMSRDVGED